VGGGAKAQGSGTVCERRVLNVDPNRERSCVPELEGSKLRKVAFCVDVEIAGGPKYKEPESDEEEKKRKKEKATMKERAEGEALKNPDAVKTEKETTGAVKAENEKLPPPDAKVTLPASEAGDGEILLREEAADQETAALDADTESTPSATSDRKREKKKKSEEERKERKEKRRKRAEENGMIPVEFDIDADVLAELDSDTVGSCALAPPSISLGATPTQAAPVSAPTSGPAPGARKDRPTTDPVRIYRRCCQLRETPILKRITEQLMAPTCCMPQEPGVVHLLNLTGSRLQLADMVTLGDWLAVVPVKKLLLENADMTDEGLRCVLAGLLSAKTPEPTRRKNVTPRHRETIPRHCYQERAGIIEKLNLKNNPRITRVGWKYIGMFLFACRSIRAIDLSMIRFPSTFPPQILSSAAKVPRHAAATKGQDIDAAEVFHHCISQRLGGDRLEELILSECGLTASQISRIVDGAIASSIKRLGFADSNLDDEGLDHVLRYLQSGACGGLDIGGNDFRGKTSRIAQAVQTPESHSCWGLSLAACNLDSESVKELFPALLKMSDLRFVDFSHNQDLCSQDQSDFISLLRRYIGRFKAMRRLHLNDVGMSPKQAIALADVLPEGPRLSHLSLRDNPLISALANAKDEASQEEACALYASYMAAVRVSKTLYHIDVDVPSPESSEIVKALAKQIVAYSLRNMEQFTIADVAGVVSHGSGTTVPANGDRKEARKIEVPDVLMHLVGRADGESENNDQNNLAPDDDYIVGGTGVVRALQYVLGEKAGDDRRSRSPGGIRSGTITPRERPGSASGLREEQRIKAKEMSKDLLNSARQIRARLQPALAKEYAAGDEMAYRRLMFLDQTLQNMVQRFETEYPETRLDRALSPPASALDVADLKLPLHTTRSPIIDQFTAPPNTSHGIELPFDPDDDDLFPDDDGRTALRSRHNSDVSLTSRALVMEEGHLHRLGQQLRREIVDSPASQFAIADDDIADGADLASLPALSLTDPEEEEARLRDLQDKLDATTGEELRQSMVEDGGWNQALRKVGVNMADLRTLQERDPRSWELFVEAQLKARMNVAQTAGSSRE